MITPRNSSLNLQTHPIQMQTQMQHPGYNNNQPGGGAPAPKHQTINSNQLPRQDCGPADRRVSTLDHQRSFSRESNSTQTSAYSTNKTSPASTTMLEKSEEQLKDLARKLRESEEKRRLMMVEYQQKIDNERKRNLNLQKKLDDSRASNADLASPASPALSEKVKAFETQRKALREALSSLRTRKDIEIMELREQNIRLRAAQATAITPSPSSVFRHSPSGSTSSSSGFSRPGSVARQRAQSSPVRLGFGPFLPVAGPSRPEPIH